MNRFLRFHYLALLPMAFVIPLWLIFGIYHILGTSIYFYVALVYVLATPVIFTGLVVCFVLLRTRPDGALSRTAGSLDSLLLTILYLVVLVHSFCIPGYNEESDTLTDSFATRLLGGWFRSTSDNLDLLSFYAVPLVLFGCLLVFFFEWKNKLSIEVALPTKWY